MWLCQSLCGGLESYGVLVCFHICPCTKSKYRMIFKVNGGADGCVKNANLFSVSDVKNISQIRTFIERYMSLLEHVFYHSSLPGIF